MAKSIMKPSRRSMDVNAIAHELVQQSTQGTFAERFEQEYRAPGPHDPAEPKIARANPGISEYMAAIGKKGGKVGGKRRLKTMTAAQRKKSAQKAAKARWGKKKK